MLVYFDRLIDRVGVCASRYAHRVSRHVCQLSSQYEDRCPVHPTVTGDFNTGVGRFGTLEACLGGRCELLAQCTNNGNKLHQFCADNHLFICNMSFRHNSGRTTTRRSNFTINQVRHVAVAPVLSKTAYRTGPRTSNQVNH